MTARLWVVEMLVGGRWKPTVGVALTRSDARNVVMRWRSNNVSDEFRVSEYVRYESKKRTKS